MSIDGIAEVFNVFNSPNWTLDSDQASRQYNQRILGENRSGAVRIQADVLEASI